MWSNKPLPNQFRDWSQSWRDNHKDWKYKLWDDEGCNKLIEKEYPWFLSTYNNYKFPIQRYDAVRYFILYHYGGLYVDMDIWCKKNTNRLFNYDTDCVLFDEYPINPLDNKIKLLTNSIMYSPPKSKFFRMVTKSLETAYKEEKYKEYPETVQVLYTTGPMILTSLYERYNKIFNIKKHNNICFEYCSQKERHNKLDKNDYSCPAESYGIHWMSNTWIASKNEVVR
jgi:mannosyltransferase OCH1-like enzyme